MIFPILLLRADGRYGLDGAGRRTASGGRPRAVGQDGSGRGGTADGRDGTGRAGSGIQTVSCSDPTPFVEPSHINGANPSHRCNPYAAHIRPIYSPFITHIRPVDGLNKVHTRPIYSPHTAHRPIYGLHTAHIRPIYGHIRPIYDLRQRSEPSLATEANPGHRSL